MKKLAFQRQISDILDSAERVRNKARRNEFEQRTRTNTPTQQAFTPPTSVVARSPPPLPTKPAQVQTSTDQTSGAVRSNPTYV